VELVEGITRTNPEVLMSHANAPLSPTGRLRLARCVVDQGWPLRRAADRFGVSVTCAHRWATRYRHHGPAGMVDRSSRPSSCPHRTTVRTERRVVGLRVSHRWGPARIAYHLGLNISTVGRILARYGCPRLTFTDPATGTRIRRTRPTRYEHPRPGDLLHVDIKKLGRIPDGGGHKALGRAAGGRNRHAHQDPTRPRRKDVSGGRPNLGYVYLHHAVDDHSRLAYSEILPDETKQSAAAFMTRALQHFAGRGITVARVLTDNGSCYRSRDFAQVLAAAQVKHKRTRPYRPQTNGKVERFNRTLQEEWAYAHPYTSESERAAAYPEFLHRYNHHRPHTSLQGASPADRVTNLPGQYT
jgi:transposase InsO family protein